MTDLSTLIEKVKKDETLKAELNKNELGQVSGGCSSTVGKSIFTAGIACAVASFVGAARSSSCTL